MEMKTNLKSPQKHKRPIILETPKENFVFVVFRMNVGPRCEYYDGGVLHVQKKKK